MDSLAWVSAILAVLHIADKLCAGVRLHGQFMLGQPSQRSHPFYRPAQLFHPEKIYGKLGFSLFIHRLASFFIERLLVI